LCFAAPRKEIRRGKIDGFGDIEVVVESRVIGLGEGDDELPCFYYMKINE